MPDEQSVQCDVKNFLQRMLKWNIKAFEIIYEELKKPSSEAVRDNLLLSLALTGKSNNTSLSRVLDNYTINVEKTIDAKMKEEINWLESLYQLEEEKDDGTKEPGIVGS